MEEETKKPSFWKKYKNELIEAAVFGAIQGLVATCVFVIATRSSNDAESPIVASHYMRCDHDKVALVFEHEDGHLSSIPGTHME